MSVCFIWAEMLTLKNIYFYSSQQHYLISLNQYTLGYTTSIKKMHEYTVLTNNFTLREKKEAFYKICFVIVIKAD